MSTDDINAGSPLARVLDDYPVPEFSTGFADRVAAAAALRAPALPELRRNNTGSKRGWRLGRRLTIASLSFGVLATAAAASGVFQRFDLPVPSSQSVLASFADSVPVVAARAVPKPPLDAASVGDPVARGSVTIEGTIDTPEELQEAFRRIDEVRQGRAQARSQRIEQRIATAIERRRAAGLQVPAPNEEARIRQRIADAQAKRDQAGEERLKARREEFERKIEIGEALTREDILRPLREDAQALQRRERIGRLTRMSPEQRRKVLRRLPPEQRRALIEEYRVRRTGTAAPMPAPVPASSPAPDLSIPPAE